MAIAIGASQACALLSDGRVKGWGTGEALGLGEAVVRGDDPNDMGDNLPTVELYSDTW